MEERGTYRRQRNRQLDKVLSLLLQSSSPRPLANYSHVLAPWLLPGELHLAPLALSTLNSRHRLSLPFQPDQTDRFL